MSYLNNFESSMNAYKALMEDFTKDIFSDRYFEILGEMPFAFLDAIHLCENLKLYEDFDKKPKMSFSTLDEAKSIYRKLITFQKKSGMLLDNASFISEVAQKAKTINALVLENPYLNNTLCVEVNETLVNIAEKCLEMVPQYPQLLTKDFRWNYIESAILNLNIQDLENLVSCRIIKADDINHICLTNDDPAYIEKISYLCTALNHPLPIIASYNLKLKGVTFPNDDGTSRQENLRLLQQFSNEHPDEKIMLTAESYIYTPEIGDPEPAIRILWNNKCIGNIAKDVAEEIEEKFEHPQCSAVLDDISGGEKGINIGCKVNLQIVAPLYAKSITPVNPEVEIPTEHNN